MVQIGCFRGLKKKTREKTANLANPFPLTGFSRVPREDLRLTKEVSHGGVRGGIQDFAIEQGHRAFQVYDLSGRDRVEAAIAISASCLPRESLHGAAISTASGTANRCRP